MRYVRSETTIQNVMTGLAETILATASDDPKLFSYVEAYASLWQLDLEQDLATTLTAGTAAENPASTRAIQPINFSLGAALDPVA
jgi:hypothetical protein